MKPAALLLVLTAAWAQAPLKPVALRTVEKPSITRTVLGEREKHLDEKITGLGGNDPFQVLGLSRGIYLEGYGAVFTLEGSLIITPTINPFRSAITKEEAVKVHQRKVEHLVLLKKTLREMWLDTAGPLTAVPDEEQVVISVRLFYQPWEDTKGLPEQITLKARRKAGLAGNIQMEEQ